MLNVYKAYSGFVVTSVATSGPNITKTTLIRAMRSVKKETLKLIETFIQRTEEPQILRQNFIPPLLEAVLGDYKMNIPDTRDPEVLSLMTIVMKRLESSMTQEVPRIFDCVFDCTLQMITTNFEDYPEHRLHFFNLLRAINSHCFPAFFMIPEQHFKLVIDSIVWAFKHTMRNIAETGLHILEELWKNISQSEVSTAFYKTYFLSLLQDLFVVLTDTFHKSGFKMQATMIQRMIQSVENMDVVKCPLNTVDPTMDNKVFLRQHVMNLLSVSFPNLTKQQVQEFVFGLFAFRIGDIKFQSHLHDFLVRIKEFSSGDDNAELTISEREATEQREREEQRQHNLQIPGMIAPNDLDNMTDS